jgi:hypothetical protein
MFHLSFLFGINMYITQAVSYTAVCTGGGGGGGKKTYILIFWSVQATQHQVLHH